MRLIALLLTLIALAGCARPAPVEPVSAPPAPPVIQDTPPVPPAAGPPVVATPAREELGGGFRVGPYEGVWNVRWASADRLHSSQGRLDLGGGRPQPYAPDDEEGKPVVFWGYHRRPDGAAVVVVDGKRGPGRFVDLRTEAAHELQAPKVLAAAVKNSWAPDGGHYLVHSERSDPVPGFYLFDGAGRPAFTFHEPGQFSLAGSWSPDGQRVAFLSVPIERRYPSHPEALADLPLAPRVGILDVNSRTARYVSLGDGQAAWGSGVWSPDGRYMAIACGTLHIYTYRSQEWTGELAAIRQNGICLIETATLEVQRLGTGDAADLIHVPVAFAPDSTALLVRSYKDDRSGEERFWLLSLTDERVELPLAQGTPVWVEAGRLAVVVPKEKGQEAVLVDRQGRTLASLAAGVEVRDLALSPDGAHLALAVATARSAERGPHQVYIYVLRTGP